MCGSLSIERIELDSVRVERVDDLRQVCEHEASEFLRGPVILLTGTPLRRTRSLRSTTRIERSLGRRAAPAALAAEPRDRATKVYRRWGRRWLVLELPAGGVTSVQVEDTDVLDAEPVITAPRGTTTLSCEGARRLLGLLDAGMARLARDAAADRAGEGRAR